jgi:hypothetical protein
LLPPNKPFTEQSFGVRRLIISFTVSAAQKGKKTSNNSRGNHRRDIFRDESDRVAYLERVEHYRERYRCLVYAYVLMSNHVHFLIETGAVGLFKDHARDPVQLYPAL